MSTIVFNIYTLLIILFFLLNQRCKQLENIIEHCQRAVLVGVADVVISTGLAAHGVHEDCGDFVLGEKEMVAVGRIATLGDIGQ